MDTAGFFQPDRTYQRRRWMFQCLAVAPNPFDQEVRAVGYLYRPGEPATATALALDDWQHGEWIPVGEDQPRRPGDEDTPAPPPSSPRRLSAKHPTAALGPPAR